jgi:hypothetical protein
MDGHKNHPLHEEPTTFHRPELDPNRINLVHSSYKPKRPPDGSGLVWGFIGGLLIWLFVAITALAVYRAVETLMK